MQHINYEHDVSELNLTCEKCGYRFHGNKARFCFNCKTAMNNKKRYEKIKAKKAEELCRLKDLA